MEKMSGNKPGRNQVCFDLTSSAALPGWCNSFVVKLKNAMYNTGVVGGEPIMQFDTCNAEKDWFPKVMILALCPAKMLNEKDLLQ